MNYLKLFFAAFVGAVLFHPSTPLRASDAALEEVAVHDLDIIATDSVESSRGPVIVRLRDGKDVVLDVTDSSSPELLIALTAQTLKGGGSAILWSQSGGEWSFSSPLSPEMLAEVAGLEVDGNHYRLVVDTVELVAGVAQPAQFPFWSDLKVERTVGVPPPPNEVMNAISVLHEECEQMAAELKAAATARKVAEAGDVLALQARQRGPASLDIIPLTSEQPSTSPTPQEN